MWFNRASDLTEHNRISEMKVTGAICPTGKSPPRRSQPVSSPSAKNILLRRLVETALLIPPSRPTEGRLAIVMNAGRDAVDAEVPKDERRLLPGEAIWRRRVLADGEDVWS